VAIPTALMKRDPDLRSLCTSEEFTVWMGAGFNICGGVDHSGKRYNLSINSEPNPGMVGGDWYTDYPMDKISPMKLPGLNTVVQKLLKLGRTCNPTVHNVYEAQENLVDRTSKIVLVGDAAHSSPVHGSNNSSMAVEDAVTLGNLFSRVSNRNQIPFILEAYEEIRQPRTSATQDSELTACELVSLHPGEKRDFRDMGMRMTLHISFHDEWTEEEEMVLANVWQDYLTVFYHDANEAADDWWRQFGGLMTTR